MTFTKAIAIAQRGLETWKAKPHNARWWRRIDGTPIPNDLLVNIAEAFVGEALSARPVAPVEAPGHTDLMVSPESINAFMEANPLPLPAPPADGEVQS